MLMLKQIERIMIQFNPNIIIFHFKISKFLNTMHKLFVVYAAIHLCAATNQ